MAVKNDERPRATNTLIYWIVGAVVIAIMWWAKPSYSSAPKVVVLPIHAAVTAISPTQVVLYGSNVLDQPIHYRRMAYINMEQHISNDAEATANELISRAKAEAAAMGANGIIVNVFGHSTATTAPSQRIYVFRGVAIQATNNETTTESPATSAAHLW